MKNQKTTKKWLILFAFAILWIIALTFIYPTLPELIPIQFSLSGNISNKAYKANVFLAFGALFVGYMLYTWIRYKDKDVPNKNFFTLYFLIFFSLFIIILGTILSN